MLYLEWSERLTANMGLLTTFAAGATQRRTASPVRYRLRDTTPLIIIRFRYFDYVCYDAFGNIGISL